MRGKVGKVFFRHNYLDINILSHVWEIIERNWEKYLNSKVMMGNLRAFFRFILWSI